MNSGPTALQPMFQFAHFSAHALGQVYDWGDASFTDWGDASFTDWGDATKYLSSSHKSGQSVTLQWKSTHMISSPRKAVRHKSYYCRAHTSLMDTFNIIFFIQWIPIDCMYVPYTIQKIHNTSTFQLCLLVRETFRQERDGRKTSYKLNWSHWRCSIEQQTFPYRSRILNPFQMSKVYGRNWTMSYTTYLYLPRDENRAEEYPIDKTMTSCTQTVNRNMKSIFWELADWTSSHGYMKIL